MTGPDAATARATIRGYLFNDLLIRTDLRDDDDLLVGGLLDSLSVVRFVAMLEAEFDLTIPPEDLIVQNLASVDAVVAYLARREVLLQ